MPKNGIRPRRAQDGEKCGSRRTSAGEGMSSDVQKSPAIMIGRLGALGEVSGPRDLAAEYTRGMTGGTAHNRLPTEK